MSSPRTRAFPLCPTALPTQGCGELLDQWLEGVPGTGGALVTPAGSILFLRPEQLRSHPFRLDLLRMIVFEERIL